MAKEWYVIHTNSAAENRVKALLDKKIAELNLYEQISQVLIPTEEVIELHDGKPVKKVRRTYPGYVLVQMEMSTENWNVVRAVARVTGFIGGVEPVPIPQADVDAMLSRASEQAPRLMSKFNKGDSIEVTDGPFLGFPGMIDEVNVEREKVRVIVSVFGRQTPIELSYLQIRRMKG
ncbi:transcription termination/antitermination protein NusG [Deferribacterales bacterium RsTz2092]|nr:transcription termination/antitermination protein NusG [Deferribacterales bacterium]